MYKKYVFILLFLFSFKKILDLYLNYLKLIKSQFQEINQSILSSGCYTSHSNGPGHSPTAKPTPSITRNNLLLAVKHLKYFESKTLNKFLIMARRDALSWRYKRINQISSLQDNSHNLKQEIREMKSMLLKKIY